MTPYGDFLYFGVLLIYIVLPTVVVRLVFGVSKAWILIATLAMLTVQYFGTLKVGPDLSLQEIWIVAAYALFQWLVALVFLWARARTKSRWPKLGKRAHPKAKLAHVPWA